MANAVRPWRKSLEHYVSVTQLSCGCESWSAEKCKSCDHWHWQFPDAQNSCGSCNVFKGMILGVRPWYVAANIGFGLRGRRKSKLGLVRSGRIYFGWKNHVWKTGEPGYVAIEQIRPVLYGVVWSEYHYIGENVLNHAPSWVRAWNLKSKSRKVESTRYQRATLKVQPAHSFFSLFLYQSN